MQQILQHLKKHGEAMGLDIAKAIVALLGTATVKDSQAGLAARNEAIMCHMPAAPRSKPKA